MDFMVLGFKVLGFCMFLEFFPVQEFCLGLAEFLCVCFQKCWSFLLMDFRVEKFENQIHVLNAPSPGATASLAIANYIINNYINN